MICLTHIYAHASRDVWITWHTLSQTLVGSYHTLSPSLLWYTSMVGVKRRLHTHMVSSRGDFCQFHVFVIDGSLHCLFEGVDNQHFRLGQGQTLDVNSGRRMCACMYGYTHVHSCVHGASLSLCEWASACVRVRVWLTCNHLSTSVYFSSSVFCAPSQPEPMALACVTAWTQETHIFSTTHTGCLCTDVYIYDTHQSHMQVNACTHVWTRAHPYNIRIHASTLSRWQLFLPYTQHKFRTDQNNICRSYMHVRSSHVYNCNIYPPKLIAPLYSPRSCVHSIHTYVVRWPQHTHSKSSGHCMHNPLAHY